MIKEREYSIKKRKLKIERNLRNARRNKMMMQLMYKMYKSRWIMGRWTKKEIREMKEL
jgi:hypothetical protein